MKLQQNVVYQSKSPMDLKLHSHLGMSRADHQNLPDVWNLQLRICRYPKPLLNPINIHIIGIILALLNNYRFLGW